MKHKTIFIVLVLFLLALSLSYAVDCGDVITADTNMTGNIYCNDTNGVTINASDVTLDCNSYEIHSNCTNNIAIILGSEASGFTMQNCKITNFSIAICGGCNNIHNINLSDITIRDTSIIGSSTGMDFWQSAVYGTHVKDLTLTNINITSAAVIGIDLNVDGCDWNNIRIMCAAVESCQTPIYFDWFKNCYINNLYVNQYGNINLESGWDTSNNIVFNNIDINITGSFIVENAGNITLSNGVIKTTDWIISGGGSSDVLIEIIDVDYIGVVYGEVYDVGLEGIVNRYWTSDITTNIGGVSGEAVSALSEITAFTTALSPNEQTTSVLLLAETFDNGVLTNSTPYSIQGTYQEQSASDTIELINENAYLSGFNWRMLISQYPFETFLSTVIIIIILIYTASSLINTIKRKK